MKKGLLIPLSLVCLLTMVGCNAQKKDGSQSSEPESQESQSQEESSDTESPVEYGVAITNKDAVGTIYLGAQPATLEIALTPAGNVAAELYSGNLVVSSSDTEVVSVAEKGRTITAVAEGTATITVTYHGKTDSVEVTVDLMPEPAHVTATVAEILDNIAAGKEKDVIYEVQGKISAWQAGKADATKYGNYILQDLEDESKTILVYGSSANADDFKIEWKGVAYEYTQGDNAKDFLTNNLTKDCGIGSLITLECIGYSYSGTPEISGIVTAVDNSGVEETEYPEPAVVNATMAEVWADTRGNGAVKFHVTGVTLKNFATNKGVATEAASKYGNALLGEDGEYFAYGLTATASALVWAAKANMYSFTNPQDFLTNDVTKDLKAGAVLDLDVIRADYNTTKEVVCVITNVVSNGD